MSCGSVNIEFFVQDAQELKKAEVMWTFCNGTWMKRYLQRDESCVDMPMILTGKFRILINIKQWILSTERKWIRTVRLCDNFSCSSILNQSYLNPLRFQYLLILYVGIHIAITVCQSSRAPCTNMEVLEYIRSNQYLKRGCGGTVVLCL